MGTEYRKHFIGVGNPRLQKNRFVGLSAAELVHRARETEPVEQLVVSAVGVAVMIAVAAFMDWFAARTGRGERVLEAAPPLRGGS